MRIVGDLCRQWDMAFSPKSKDAKLQARRACQTQLHDAATGKRAQGHGCEGWLFISHTVRSSRRAWACARAAPSPLQLLRSPASPRVQARPSAWPSCDRPRWCAALYNQAIAINHVEKRGYSSQVVHTCERMERKYNLASQGLMGLLSPSRQGGMFHLVPSQLSSIYLKENQWC
jgi:hypothetical protein